MFILLLFSYWLLVSAPQGHRLANIYKKLKMLVHIKKMSILLDFNFFVNIGLLTTFWGRN